jgi:hypothetical protein
MQHRALVQQGEIGPWVLNSQRNHRVTHLDELLSGFCPGAGAHRVQPGPQPARPRIPNIMDLGRGRWGRASHLDPTF